MTEIEEMKLVIETIGAMDIKGSIKCNLLKHVSSMIEKKKIRDLTKIEGVEVVQLHKNASSNINSIENNLKNAIKEYNSCKTAIKILDEKRNDILHHIELNELDDEDLLKLSKELKRISEARRLYKDHKFMIEPLMNFATMMNYSDLNDKLNDYMAETCKRIGKVKQQKYTPKQLTLSDVLEHD